MHGHGMVEIIDLKKDRVAISIERAKVMLLMRIVGVTKVVKVSIGVQI
jgi:hypothetical protein